MLDLSLAISHHLLVFMLFGILFAELVLVRPGIDQVTAGRVAALDLWYGVIAAVIILVGFSRAIFAAKGWDYYAHNAFFWAKIGTFVAIALLSVSPTIAYMRCRGASLAPSDAQIREARRYLWLECVLFALLPAFAAAMARGYGEFGV
jgi:putative membrane protein